MKPPRPGWDQLALLPPGAPVVTESPPELARPLRAFLTELRSTWHPHSDGVREPSDEVKVILACVRSMTGVLDLRKFYGEPHVQAVAGNLLECLDVLWHVCALQPTKPPRAEESYRELHTIIERLERMSPLEF